MATSIRTGMHLGACPLHVGTIDPGSLSRAQIDRPTKGAPIKSPQAQGLRVTSAGAGQPQRAHCAARVPYYFIAVILACVWCAPGTKLYESVENLHAVTQSIDSSSV